MKNLRKNLDLYEKINNINYLYKQNNKYHKTNNFAEDNQLNYSIEYKINEYLNNKIIDTLLIESKLDAEIINMCTLFNYDYKDVRKITLINLRNRYKDLLNKLNYALINKYNICVDDIQINKMWRETIIDSITFCDEKNIDIIIEDIVESLTADKVKLGYEVFVALYTICYETDIQIIKEILGDE